MVCVVQEGNCEINDALAADWLVPNARLSFVVAVLVLRPSGPEVCTKVCNDIRTKFPDNVCC
jgi:hypothetical protein